MFANTRNFKLLHKLFHQETNFFYQNNLLENIFLSNVCYRYAIFHPFSQIKQDRSFFALQEFIFNSSLIFFSKKLFLKLLSWLWNFRFEIKQIILKIFQIKYFAYLMK